MKSSLGADQLDPCPLILAAPVVPELLTQIYHFIWISHKTFPQNDMSCKIVKMLF